MDKKLSICTMRDLPFNPTLCQNLMIFHQTIDLNMKFRYSWIINDHQIHEKHNNSPQTHRFQQVRVKIGSKRLCWTVSEQTSVAFVINIL